MASPSAKDKGKGRANEILGDASAYWDSNDGAGEASNATTTDYETALESTLDYSRNSSTHGQHDEGTNGHHHDAANGRNNDDDDDDEDDRFVYDGQDDEDMKIFREDAKLESLDYKERLRGVLGGSDVGDAEEDTEVGEPPTPRPSHINRANGPSTSTPPRSPQDPSPSILQSPSSLNGGASAQSDSAPAQHELLPPSQPFPRPKARPSSVSSFSSIQSTSQYQGPSSPLATASNGSSRFGSLPLRRPPMNPLVSRLRSTSATPSQSFRGVRSVSQASSLASLAYRDAEGLHGFANESFTLQPDESFASLGINGKRIPSLGGSRRSSASNLQELNKDANGGFDMTPSMSSENLKQDGDASTATLFPLARRKARSKPLPQVHKLVPPLKWTVLKRLSQKMFSKSLLPTSADIGNPTCLAVSGGLIILGTTKGWTAIYDYSQTMKTVVGDEDIVKSCGSVTAVALSQDTTFVAVAYRSGHIHLFEWGKKPNVPARTVIPTTLQAVNAGKAEGHLARNEHGHGSEIRHLGFVGSRHTAIVSGDQYGLAFYHSLGKVLGLANTDILRILGKYPTQLAHHTVGEHSDPAGDLSFHHTNLLAMQPLPLGTEEHLTDSINLVALLTPHKLVVAGLKPSPRTWWRCINTVTPVEGHVGPEPGISSSHSSDVASQPAHGTNGTSLKPDQGCLAWLPSIEGSPPMLAYCWSNTLRIVRIEKMEVSANTNGSAKPGKSSGSGQAGVKAKEAPIALRFRSLSSASTARHAPNRAPTGDEQQPVFICDETVVALQWLSRRILVLLTASKIVLFDAETLKAIEHCDHFGTDFHIPTMRPFEQSFKAYKGKLFYLTSRDLRVGSVLSWADRVLYLVSSGRLVQAIDLLVLYYGASHSILRRSREGEEELNLPFTTLELPPETEERKLAVEPRLREILAATTEYVFSEDRMKDESRLDRAGKNRGVDRTDLFESLVDAIIRASLATGSFEFLFDELAERYSMNGIEAIFLERLEPFILSGDIKHVPVIISQQLISRRAEAGEMDQVEALIWHMDPDCLDVNQAVSLCSKYRLYDALIYVYTRALQDFVGPFVELLSLLVKIMSARKIRPSRIGVSSAMNHSPPDNNVISEEVESLVPVAYTIYPYLADSLVGLSHPSQEPLEAGAASNAKQSLYSFLFSPTLRAYPPGSHQLVHTECQDALAEPYLRLLLSFDTEATLGCLDIAMEDSYLDEDAGVYGTPDRQKIMQTLLSILEEDTTSEAALPQSDRTFICIFMARNLPKYTQFVSLPDDKCSTILQQLCQDPDLSTHQDRELAIEYLLSAYTPVYAESLLQMLEHASFYRVLASIYRSKKAWPQLVSVYIRDEESGHEVFALLAHVIRDCQHDKGHLALVSDEIMKNIDLLVQSGVAETAELVERHFPDKHAAAIQALEGNSLRQMAYLRTLLEPDLAEQSTPRLKFASAHLSTEQKYRYVALLSQHDPSSVIRYMMKEPALEEDKVVKICSERENFEAIIWVQARHGALSKALGTSRHILQTQSEDVFSELLNPNSRPLGLQRRLRSMHDVGRAAIQVAGKACRKEISNCDMPLEEVWYNVLSALIDIVRSVSRSIDSTESKALPEGVGSLVQSLKQLVPEAISILIASTSSATMALPHLVRRLMDESADATYAEYRGILDSMLDTYRFEGDLLATANRLLAADLHGYVAELVQNRDTGWRPNISGVCEACGLSVWTTVSERQRLSDPHLVVRSASDIEVSERLRSRPKVRRRPSLKGKETDWYEEEPQQRDRQTHKNQSLVVFRGGAICHASCLEHGGNMK